MAHTRVRRLVALVGAATLLGPALAWPANAATPRSVIVNPQTTLVTGALATYFNSDSQALKGQALTPGAMSGMATSAYKPSADARFSALKAAATEMANDGLIPATVQIENTYGPVLIVGSTAMVDVTVQTTLTWPSSVGQDPSVGAETYHTAVALEGGGWKVSQLQAYDPSEADTTDDAPPGATVDVGTSDLGVPSSDDRSTANSGASATKNSAEAVAAGWSPPSGMNYYAMTNYAKYWSVPARGNNPAYHHYGTDCTNFVSQALRTGGWPQSGGTNFLNYDDDHRWARDVGTTLGYKDTYSWASAKHLEVFSRWSNRTAYLNNIWNARLGDLLFTDWDPNGRANGSIDHVMMVTGWNKQPFISQHTPPRSNIPLSLTLTYAKQQHKTKIIWYGRIT